MKKSLLLTIPILLSLITAVEAAVIFIPPSSPSRPSSGTIMECIYIEDDLYRCRETGHVTERPIGIKPIYHCSFIARSNIQRLSCTDGKGSQPSELRDSGPHPRERFKR